MDEQVNGQVNLYVYDSENIKCYIDGVAAQICKKLDYPLHVRKITNVGKSESWKDFTSYLTLYDIKTTDEEGDIKKSPIYSVILVEYQSLCSSHIHSSIWFKMFSFVESQKVYTFEENSILNLVKACNVIKKNSVTFPPIILSGFNGTNTEKKDVERILNSYGVPDNWIIYLDKNDENESLESLEFNINYFMRTFWKNNIHQSIFTIL
jgi:hypothetical protein